jgi:hypothetical protein
VKKSRAIWTIATIVIVVSLVTTSLAFFLPAYAEHSGELEQSMVATYEQPPNGSLSMNAGKYQLKLSSPVSQSIPNLGIEIISDRSQAVGYETSISSLQALGSS